MPNVERVSASSRATPQTLFSLKSQKSQANPKLSDDFLSDRDQRTIAPKGAGLNISSNQVSIKNLSGMPKNEQHNSSFNQTYANLKSTFWPAGILVSVTLGSAIWKRISSFSSSLTKLSSNNSEYINNTNRTLRNFSTRLVNNGQDLKKLTLETRDIINISQSTQDASSEIEYQLINSAYTRIVAIQAKARDSISKIDAHKVQEYWNDALKSETDRILELRSIYNSIIKVFKDVEFDRTDFKFFNIREIETIIGGLEPAVEKFASHMKSAT